MRRIVECAALHQFCGKPQLLNNFSNELCSNLKFSFLNVVKEEKPEGFNKLRKPIDIFIEYLVSLCDDLKDRRRVLIPLLYLPLVGQMFQSCYVFDDEEIESFNLKRTFTFSDINVGEDYQTIQSFLKEKAKKIMLTHRIYFDLIWGNRYRNNARNLCDLTIGK